VFVFFETTTVLQALIGFLLGYNHFHAICAFVDGVEENLIPMLYVQQPYDTELMAEELESVVWTISDS
jgi:hypothetical protein